MTLIADSGSTKTTWMVVETGEKVVTEGLNPHFTGDDAFLAACRSVFENFQFSTFNFQLYFYGAGCGDAAQRARVKRLLGEAFGTKASHVETDMLGACRAVCGERPGLVGILGTGSNACYYDGKEIAERLVSTGYILGDHGSANHVGRLLLQDYLAKVMPEHARALFYEAYPFADEDFIEAVYHRPNANRFLASLAKFAALHLADDYCHTVVEASLRQWYHYQVDALHRRTGCGVLHLVGGFAVRVSDVVNTVVEAHGLKVGRVVADPIEGLRQYHRGKEN